MQTLLMLCCTRSKWRTCTRHPKAAPQHHWPCFTAGRHISRHASPKRPLRNQSRHKRVSAVACCVAADTATTTAICKQLAPDPSHPTAPLHAHTQHSSNTHLAPGVKHTATTYAACCGHLRQQLPTQSWLPQTSLQAVSNTHTNMHNYAAHAARPSRTQQQANLPSTPN
jgi:hypothetical protein